MKVMVIGKDGQLARSLLEKQGSRSIAIEGTARPDLDFCDPASIEAAIARIAPAIVVNAAAYTAVDKAESEPDLAHAINATGAGAVAKACARHAIPIIQISTDYVYAGDKTSAYTEDDPVAPAGVYGRTKLEGERLVAAACRQHIILRTAWVYSPFGNNFVKTMLRLAASRSELGVVDDQTGCPTYAPHLADAILAVCDRILAPGNPSPSWGIYHAAGTGEATWCGFARAVFKLSSERGGPSATVRAITTAEYPTPAKRPANSRLDGTKLAKNFGVKLPDWRAGAAECVARLVEAG